MNFKLILLLLGISTTLAACVSDGGTIATPSAPREIINFTSVNTTVQGGEVGEIVYSENPGDVEISGKVISQGVVMVVGRAGKNKGSTWAGVGLNVPVGPKNTTLDARGYRSMTIKLASPTSGFLRLRLYGPEWEVTTAGCYPIYVQAVNAKPTEYTIPLSAFASENWCGPKARSVRTTLAQLTSVEIVDTAITNKETRLVIGSVRLNP